MTKVGFIGTGHIAAPMARCLSAKGYDVTVTERSEAISSALVKSHKVAISDAAGVVAASNIVFLCVRPQHANEALTGLPWRLDHRIVSVMAGVSEAQLRTLCAPAERIVQTIPLGFLEKGGCPLAAYGDVETLKALFAPENPVVPVASEAALNAHFAICAMVPGLLDLMESGAAWLGSETGDAKRAAFYTTQLLSGFLATMQESLGQERDALATDGTLSLQMVDGLRDGGAHAVLKETLGAIGARLKGA